jgi:RNA polymerase sigma factor (sigma-70 family)
LPDAVRLLPSEASDGVGAEDDKARFANVILPLLHEAYALARTLTGNRADAEDVVQEACLRAFRAINTIAGNPRAWLLAIVRNSAYTWLAKNRPQVLVIVDDLDAVAAVQASAAPHDAATPESALIRKADDAQVDAAITALPMPFRETVMLRDVHGRQLSGDQSRDRGADRHGDVPARAGARAAGDGPRAGDRMTPPVAPVADPPAPDDPVLLIHAYLDGELDPAAALDIERRMAADPALAAERRRVEALRRRLQDLPREDMPPDLRAKVERAVGLPRGPRRPTWMALAASILVSASLASGLTWLALDQPRLTTEAAPAATRDAILAAHVRGLMAPSPADVLSTDRHTVKPWFAGRIADAPRVIDLAESGFPLVGGRVDVVGRAPVPTLVYRRREHLISLTAVRAPGASAASPSRSSANGYNVVTWAQDGVAYWAVSDVMASDLLEFMHRFSTQD